MKTKDYTSTGYDIIDFDLSCDIKCHCPYRKVPYGQCLNNCPKRSFSCDSANCEYSQVITHDNQLEISLKYKLK